MDSQNKGVHSTQRSEELYRKAVEVLPGGISRNTVYRKPFPYYVAGASGCYVTDIDGNRYLDFANNMASLIHGHAHPAIVEAVTGQLKKGTAYTLATEPELNLARLLCDRVPGFDKIRFVNSGTEAVMAMIKASRAYTGRPKIAKAEGAYHGTYDYAEVSQGSNPSNWGDPDRPASNPQVSGTPAGVLNDVVVYPFNDIARTLAILDAHADQIACVLIDPIPHRVGMVPATQEFVEALYQWTRKSGALLAFDEVVTFRVNYEGAQENYPYKPDLTALGKIIGGGFPVGAIAGRSEVMNVMDPRQPKLLFPLSGTFSANPISATAGYAAMKLFDRDAVNRVNELAGIAIRQIEEAARLADVPVSLTGAGSMFRIHPTATPPSSYREAYQPKELAALVDKMLDYMLDQENIIMINTFSCMLSTVTGREEIDRLSEALLNCFRMIRPDLERYHNPTKP